MKVVEVNDLEQRERKVPKTPKTLKDYVTYMIFVAQISRPDMLRTKSVLSVVSIINRDLHIGKAKRIKQAKEEAEIEIEKYRAERQKHYEEFEERYLGTTDDVAAQIEKDVNNYLAEIEKMIAINKDKVTARNRR
ncbi:unnamed protein product [Ceutorhynchus assimilis]|uniref:V-type proton ATPase subunit G n=1 Tax=Ceutorhynchus assimilis TaxID=467358 RepID=A0A9N9MMA3_9CUCU|nr:unnamed protein product [Ceutorhynchus assimilis]